ncbi:uncharacterized protein LOC134188192 [Corticium candelabrum]|uniref:uncharacterized protein LOC134188192 n=1 Tax=Corticium candelabrum TaxID=121492 RepID=UPI002E26CD5C|nr:uncharacterized protein LOC134188192 [Corticium candelabrum]
MAMKLPETRIKVRDAKVTNESEFDESFTEVDSQSEQLVLLKVSYDKDKDEAIIAKNDSALNGGRWNVVSKRRFNGIDTQDGSSSDVQPASTSLLKAADLNGSVALHLSSVGGLSGARSAARRLSLKLKRSSAMQLLKSSDVRKVVLLYCIFSFGVIGYADIVSVWLATAKYKGGIGFSSLKIGIFTGSTALAMIPLLFFFIPWIERCLGTLQAYYLSAISLVLFCTTSPLLVSLSNDILLWTLLVALSLPLRMFIGGGFVMISVLINNSVPPNRVGSVNGLSVALSGVARALAPLTTGSAFAWSIEYGTSDVGFPLDYHLTFYLLGMAFYLSLCQAARIPEHLQQKRPQ